MKRTLTTIAALAATAMAVTAPVAQAAPQDTDAHPVVFVPGWAQSGNAYQPLQRALANRGTPSTVLRFGWGNLGFDLRHNAATVGHAVQKMARRYHSKVDVVAHSMGGLATDGYLSTSGGARVARSVSIGTPHLGLPRNHGNPVCHRGRPLPDVCSASAFMRNPALHRAAPSVARYTISGDRDIPAARKQRTGHPHCRVTVDGVSHTRQVSSPAVWRVLDRIQHAHGRCAGVGTVGR